MSSEKIMPLLTRGVEAGDWLRERAMPEARTITVSALLVLWPGGVLTLES